MKVTFTFRTSRASFRGSITLPTALVLLAITGGPTIATVLSSLIA